MLKNKWGYLFALSVGIIISAISGYSPYDWQFYAASAPIVIIGIIYAETEVEEKK